MRNLAIVLLATIGLCTGADASVSPGGKARFTGSTVTVSFQDGRTFDLAQVSVTQGTTGEVATQTWKSGGTEITVSTPRKESPAQTESVKSWAKRHKDNVDAFKTLFPPDPPALQVSGGGGVGSLPDTGSASTSNPTPSPNGTVTFKWQSGSDTVKVSASPRIDESPDQFAYRVAAAIHAHQLNYPPN